MVTDIVQRVGYIDGPVQRANGELSSLVDGPSIHPQNSAEPSRPKID